MHLKICSWNISDYRLLMLKGHAEAYAPGAAAPVVLSGAKISQKYSDAKVFKLQVATQIV